eukprot:10115910-Alexandrium_andersonii.AAC.1
MRSRTNSISTSRGTKYSRHRGDQHPAQRPQPRLGLSSRCKRARSVLRVPQARQEISNLTACLLYTSDAADDM